MKHLLHAIKSRVGRNLPYVREVFILGIDELFPAESATPALGLRDGGTTVITDPAVIDTERINEILTVPIDIFLENLLDVEAPMLGDAQTKGLLDIAVDLRTQLNDQLFTAAPDSLDFYDAYVRDETPPVLFIFPDAGKEIMKKTVTFQYRRLKAR